MHGYLCCHNPCISKDLLALLVCLTLQFVDRSRKLGRMQEFLSQGSEIIYESKCLMANRT